MALTKDIPDAQDVLGEADAAQIATQRGRIDRLDAEILGLLNERIAAAVRIGAIKKKLGLKILDTGREASVYRHLLNLNRGGLLPGRFLLRIYADLIAASRDVQRTPQQIAADAAPARFAVLGYPVGHSLSPVMHNAAFAATGFAGLYAAIPVREIGPAVAGLRALDFRGASITIPHKQAVMEWLDEVAEDARRIGAVNTVVNREGRLAGWNTDRAGAIAALREKTPLAGRQTAVLGAGGAARAVAFGIADEGGAVTIFNRGRKRGEALAAELGSEFHPLSHHLQPAAHAASRGGRGGRVHHHRRAGDVHPPGGAPVRVVDRDAGAGRGHADGRRSRTDGLLMTASSALRFAPLALQRTHSLPRAAGLARRACPALAGILRP